jgi:regulator of sigma E protease
MVVLIKVLQVVLALSILILVHEFGHFFFAKLFGIRVDKFYLFFDAGGVKLFSTKDSKWLHKIFPKLKDSETDYGIGWLPLGGYCKIAGMVDESMDLEALKEEPKSWEFRTKPAWQRLLVMAGGVLCNFILAIALYIGILAIWGTSYFDNKDKEIYVNDLAYEMGFRTGDRILSFDDYIPDNFAMLQADLVRQGTHKAKVLRGGDTLSIYIDQSMTGAVLNTPGMFDLALPFVVDSVMAGSPNRTSGLAKGDKIVEIEGQSVAYLQDSRPILLDKAGSRVTATVLRGGKDSVNLSLAVDTLGRIGVFTQAPRATIKEYTIAQAIPAGCVLAYETVEGYIKDLKLVFNPSTEAYKSVGSFISMGQIFPSQWNWYAFVSILALLSIMLGVMNLLPVPALDGGHMVFTIYEMVTGRKPSDKFLEIMQMIGLFFVLGLMFLACGNDIVRLIK